ncbi:O-methyltransferase [Pseudonocardia oroxyli]|uniref:Predicted O-methyltransferase YrrM n=1 Tax=Pseudonocardia oroxyli TaxID=366584 RepID=A0A1G7ZVY8_PSEOR|nr:O-methyltransferase [Pseudonocardia oroxyli]SDH12822.1 Predicted O-methyltransferase YrrM [Pseudonocardia oroxyli]
MDESTWRTVDEYLEQSLLPADDTLGRALAHNREAGLPAIDVSPTQGRFLQLLARITGARRILEIGTLGGYSTIELARALPADGELVTCEFDPRHAEVARANLAAAGVADLVEVRVGPALETLTTLDGPFDLVFVDADKQNNAAYVEHAIRLGRPGTVIVVDNVIRGGQVATAGGDDRVEGTRRMFEALHADTRVDATALQTVGAKGYDGFVLAVVR